MAQKKTLHMTTESHNKFQIQLSRSPKRFKALQACGPESPHPNFLETPDTKHQAATANACIDTCGCEILGLLGTRVLGCGFFRGADLAVWSPTRNPKPDPNPLQPNPRVRRVPSWRKQSVLPAGVEIHNSTSQLRKSKLVYDAVWLWYIQGCTILWDNGFGLP